MNFSMWMFSGLFFFTTTVWSTEYLKKTESRFQNNSEHSFIHRNGSRGRNWVMFWSNYENKRPDNAHLVSYANKPRKRIVSQNGKYIIVDRSHADSNDDIIPANTWIDHDTGQPIKDSRQIAKIELANKNSFSRGRKTDPLKIGYLSTPINSEKKDEIETQLLNHEITVDQFMKEKKAGSKIRDSTLGLQGWRFNVQETKTAIYGVGVKGVKSITFLWQKKALRLNEPQPSYKDLICLALEKTGVSLKMYTYAHKIQGRNTAERLLLEQLSKALDQPVQLKDIVWKKDGKELDVFKETKSVYLKNFFKNVAKNGNNSISFEVGSLRKKPLGCLRFGISYKQNWNNISDPLGTYYVYVDYVRSEDYNEPMDGDLLLIIFEKMCAFREKEVSNLSYDEQRKILAPVNNNQKGIGNYDQVDIIQSSECTYNKDRCEHTFEGLRSTPINNTGVHFPFSPDIYSYVLENGEFYVHSRHQSGINPVDELRRLAVKLEDKESENRNDNNRQNRKIINVNNVQTDFINGWHVHFYTGQKGIYGFAEQSGRTISFGQVIKDGFPINKPDIFYKAWKIGTRDRFKNLRTQITMKNKETEEQMLGIVKNDIGVQAGQSIDRMVLESKDVNGVPFKMVTVLLKKRGDVKGILKYGLSDQLKQPGVLPKIIKVGYVCGLKKQNDDALKIDDHFVNLLEKDIAVDFCCIVKSKAILKENEDDRSALDGLFDYNAGLGQWKPYSEIIQM